MIYAFVGPESFLAERAFRRLKDKLLSGLSEFNYDLLTAGVTPREKILEGLNTLPFFGGHRVILLKEVEKLKKDDLEALEPAVDKLAEGVDLVMLGGKIDRRFRFWQTVEKKGKLVEYRPLYPREVSGWMVQELAAQGVKIRPDALGWLTGVVGTDVGIIAATLERLQLLIGERKEIILADVEQGVTTFSWKSLFDLTEAVGEKKRTMALKLLSGILASGENPVGLMALIIRHFRILLKVQSSPQSSAGEIGVPPYFLGDYQRQVKKFGQKELVAKYERIYRTDWDLKSSPLPGPKVLERLVWELCS